MVEETSRTLGSSKVGKVIGRIVLIAIGSPMAIIMAIAALYEIGAGDFFGACVSLMVVIFGLQLLSIGIRGSADALQASTRPDPLEDLWRSDERIYIVRPSHAKIEIRGRP